MVEGWSDPWAGEFGVRARTRFGLGVLRSNTIAKMRDKRFVVGFSDGSIVLGCRNFRILC